MHDCTNQKLRQQTLLGQVLNKAKSTTADMTGLGVLLHSCADSGVSKDHALSLHRNTSEGLIDSRCCNTWLVVALKR
ncbi:hypothetical protein E2C01_008956 [Portunus trituberculatus]|uniref:Uncharacterized protein n=1 Tax=Portunus trituberculatus TaxID=210409 RepID=A0A5B7D576_PORTR|nr:hypothetical protein [Portunus trituberculatus]